MLAVSAKQAAGEAGEPGTQPEGERVDARGIDAERARHARVLHGGPRVDAEARVAEERPEARDGDERDPQHEEPVVGVGELGQREAAEGRRHALDLRAEDEQRALAQQQTQPPCRHKGRQELAVEAADDDALQHHAREACADGAEDHGDAAGHAREVGERRDVGADHHHLAVRHVDDAHHAEDDDQPDRGEREDPDRVGVLVEQADDERDRFHRADRQRLGKEAPGRRVCAGPVAGERVTIPSCTSRSAHRPTGGTAARRSGARG